MVKLIKMKVDWDMPYMFCYSNEETDLEKYEGKYYIPKTGIELDIETQDDVPEKKCSILHETAHEYGDEEYEIQGVPLILRHENLEDGTEVYQTETPAYVKLDDDGINKTLLIKGLISCLAVFITNGIYLIGYHLVSGDENTNLEIDKKRQLVNLLRRFGMTPDNSTLLFYGLKQHKNSHDEPIKNLVSLLGYNTYRLIYGKVGTVIFSNELFRLGNNITADGETKQE